MKKHSDRRPLANRWTLLSIVMLGVVLVSAIHCRAEDSPQQTVAALIERILPGRSVDVVLEVIPAEAGKDVFELESRGGKIVVRGNSALSMAVGLNWYLKYYCRCEVSLNGRQLDLPKPLPVIDKAVRKVSWARARYLLNYCTFSYSMVWWDWGQWEKLIDWMALNGINMPLAITGQESVWQAVGRRFGMADSELDAFLAGPPYLPFSWMGCLDGYGGPLAKDWVSRHADLEKKILARERGLGMTPVLQGFTGHIPEALAKKYPSTKGQTIHWSEFHTFMLDPQDPLFQKVGAAFLEEQTRQFGTDHHYAADSFIEMTPPSGDLKYLADTGRAIYRGMAQADPQAVWLLQGWTFMNQAQFWTQDRIKAFLDAVPNEHMLILDLHCDAHPMWNETQGFCGKPWVWCFLYNYGNRTILGGLGPLGKFNDLAAARTHSLGHNLQGVGLMMEGYGHNPLVYDMMFELPWRENPDLSSWVRDFAVFRYGKTNANTQAAWETLRASLYDHGTDGQTAVTAFPAVGRSYTGYPASALAKAWRLLLQAAPELGERETYRHDLVNIARQAISNQANSLYAQAMAAYQAKDAAAYRKAAAAFLALLSDLDELLATNDQFLFGSWVEDARRWGATDADREKLEWNARRILTRWAPGAGLRDYAFKEWSGLVSGFYAKRWGLFFERQQAALDVGKPFDEPACDAELARFEDEWCRRAEACATKPKGDPVALAGRLYEKYCSGL